MAGVRVTRRMSDWLLVISALDAAGFQEDMIGRIRQQIKPAVPSEHVTVEAEGHDADALRLAVRLADQGRPSSWPPVYLEEVP